MTQLPPAFIRRMRAELDQDANAFFTAMEQPPMRGLRINPLKTPDQPLDTWFPELEGAVPWAADGRYLSQESAAGTHPLHACGAYYLQEASAMLPAGLVQPKPGETILDLCAAPGGKSTQLAAMMQGKGTLVCNEIVPSRAAILSGNLERMGVSNAVVVSADPARLARQWPGLFDAVLVDAPCSGEGMFRKSPEAVTEWSEDAPVHCAKRQLHILESAYAMLKPGGHLCYSTCTFSRDENEDVIEAFLVEHPDFQAVSFSVPIGEDRILHAENGCIRLYPHIINGEGHFAALLEKTGQAPDEQQPATLLPAERVFSPQDAHTLDSFFAFWRDVSPAIAPQPNAMVGSLLISAPPLPPLDGLKAYRAGLSLGRVKGQTFIPDHALALAAPPMQIRSIPLDEPAAAQYLAGEVLPAGNHHKGFYTVTFAGLPLGFVKHSDGQLKNHYPKGLRKR